MEYPALEKFMDQMGIVYTIAPGRSFFHPRGGVNICMHVLVVYKGNVEYDQFHCYNVKNGSSISYDEGNQQKGVTEGILAYLGDEDKVDQYFEEIARAKALKIIKQM